MTTATTYTYGIDRHNPSGELYATKSVSASGDFISVVGPLHYSDVDDLEFASVEWFNGEQNAQWAQEQEWTATDRQEVR